MYSMIGHTCKWTIWKLLIEVAVNWYETIQQEFFNSWVWFIIGTNSTIHTCNIAYVMFVRICGNRIITNLMCACADFIHLTHYIVRFTDVSNILVQLTPPHPEGQIHRPGWKSSHEYLPPLRQSTSSPHSQGTSDLFCEKDDAMRNICVSSIFGVSISDDLNTPTAATNAHSDRNRPSTATFFILSCDCDVSSLRLYSFHQY